MDGATDEIKSPLDTAKASKANTAGGRDAKRLKANKHITSDFPDRSKAARKEAEVQGLLTEQQESAFDIRKLAVLRLLSLGYSFRQIERLKGKARRLLPGLPKRVKEFPPTRQTMIRWRRTDPQFADACENSINEYIEDSAIEMIREAESIPKIPKLSPGQKLLAMSVMLDKKLQITRRRLLKWSELGVENAEVIVFEVGEGWTPTRTAVGSPGQGPEAEEAKKRWREMRDVTPEETA